MTAQRIPGQPALTTVERQLRNLIEYEEGAYHDDRREQVDSLWSHVLRVAVLADRIGIREGVDRAACRLAGLFHDAGKFVNGAYHAGDAKEEDGSVRILYEMTRDTDIPRELVDVAAQAILQLYQSNADLSILAKILFDADNLDKLGLPGIANFLIKAGLRGRGLNRTLLYRIGVELTYARYARETMMTMTGRKLADEKVPEMIDFFHHFINSLRKDGLFDFHITEENYDGVILDIVEASACECGGPIERKIWDAPGLKCQQIYLEYRCTKCDFVHELHFCRPRIEA